MSDEWSPEKCACRWGEQPCWVCLPVLSARFAARMKPQPKRKWGDAPAHVFKTFAGCWHWRCLIGEPSHQTRCCRPTRKAAMEALTDHQGTQHACPDCGGSGGDLHFQDPELGPCLRCGGHGVDLTASERSGV